MTNGQKKTTSGKVPRIEAMKEPKKQPTLKDSRGRSRKAQGSKPAKEREENPSVQTMEEKPPSPVKIQPTGIVEDDLLVESRNTESERHADSDMDTSPVAHHTLRKRRAKARYIFSGSSTDDDSSGSDVY